jgi:phosphopantetheinyl transferase
MLILRNLQQRQLMHQQQLQQQQQQQQQIAQQNTPRPPNQSNWHFSLSYSLPFLVL